MSRHLPVTAITPARPQPSRRLMLHAGAGSALFLVHGAGDAAASAGAIWLAKHHESRRLSAQWATIEARAIGDYDWYNLTRAQRDLFIEQLELDVLANRIDGLEEQNLTAIVPLADLKAISASGVERKLEVALAVHPLEENAEGHHLIASILADFRRLFGSAS